MQRVVLALSGCLIALLCSVGSVVGLQRARDDIVPPGAGDVRVVFRNRSCLHISYHLAPDWILLDLYEYLEQHGWARDHTLDHTSHYDGMPPSTSTFAIFARQSLSGLLSEIMIVGIAPYKHPQAQARLVRCFTTGL